MIETQSILKLKEPQSQDKAHIRKASRSSALLYSLRGVHVAHKAIGSLLEKDGFVLLHLLKDTSIPGQHFAVKTK